MLDRELLDLIWVLERKLEVHPAQEALLDRIMSEPTIREEELPEPESEERESPPLPGPIAEYDGDED